jgi:thiamine biosynthesis lipoprotein
MIQETRLIMGMPITIAIADAAGNAGDLAAIFDYFTSIDEKFSPYQETSETTAVNRGLPEAAWSKDMRAVVDLAERTRRETGGYFSIRTPDGVFNPVGIVKGWAITRAADLLRARGVKNFFVDAGGDIEAAGTNADGGPWRVGIRDPFSPEKILRRLALTDLGIATSGTYIRGDHIFDPHTGRPATELASLTVIGRNACEADRFATAAFAMGTKGIPFLESRSDLEGYAIDRNGAVSSTGGFGRYIKE